MDMITQLKPLHLHSRKWQYEKKTHVMVFAAGKFGDNQMNKAMLESIWNSQEKNAAVWTHEHS